MRTVRGVLKITNANPIFTANRALKRTCESSERSGGKVEENSEARNKESIHYIRYSKGNSEHATRIQQKVKRERPRPF
jgi:hypothetical protein